MVPEVSVIIPTFNEERRIKRTIEELSEVLSKHGINYEIIVSDGGSVDKTVECIPKTKEVKVLKSSRFLPKGDSLINGALKSQGEKILFLDADMPISAEDILHLIKETGEDDLTMASRYHPMSKGKCPITRLFLGRLFNKLVRVLLNITFYDTQAGAKCLSAPLAHKVLRKVQNRGYVFDVELILHVLKQGGRVKEIPVKWAHKGGSRLKIPKVAMEMFFGVLQLTKLRYQCMFWATTNVINGK